MLKSLVIAAGIALLVAGGAIAQEDTPEPTPDITAEVTVVAPIPPATVEASAEPLVGITAETSAEPTVELTMEATGEATAEATLPAGAMLDFPGPGSYTVRQPEADAERTYRVYIPENYDETGDPVALVIIMHGAGGTGEGIESITDFDALADRENFIVAYPNGEHNAWNDGRPGDVRLSAIDDVLFLKHVVGFLKRSLNIDAQRVYAGGHSMGGMMAYRLACEAPDVFAAVASVASTMPIYLIETCMDTPPIPVIVFQGTDDPIVPWTGISNNYLSAAQTIGFWGSHNQCSGDLTVVSLPDAEPSDYTIVMRQDVSGCAADMVLYGVYFGGHTWPGHPFDASIRLGQTTYDIDATAVMWNFFNAHAKMGDTQ